MPNDKKHIEINITLLCVAIVVLLIVRAVTLGITFYWWDWLILGIASYLFATFYLSPDLDIDCGSLSKKRWSIFSWYWQLYAEWFAHRKWSHCPIIGTVTRFLYLGVIVVPILIVVCYLSGNLSLPFIAYTVAVIFTGATIADFIHEVADVIDTAIKKRRTRLLRLRKR